MTRFCSIIAFLLPFMTLPAHAGSAGPGKITDIIPINNGIFSFVLSVNRSSSPPCASVHVNRWAIDATTMAGQTLAASVITAFESGNTVTVLGTGTCPAAQPDQEGVTYLVIVK